MENQTLATEMMKELALSAKRWFIIAIIELFIILCMAGGLFWYFSLPIDESVVTVDNEDGNANYVGNDLTGAIYNGKDNSKKNTESGKK